MTSMKRCAALLVATAGFCLFAGDAAARPKIPICEYYPDHLEADCNVRNSKGDFVPCLRPAPMLVCGGVSVILSRGACQPDSAQDDFAYLMCGQDPPASAPGGDDPIKAEPSPPILQP
jgi:hypothetical protein